MATNKSADDENEYFDKFLETAERIYHQPILDSYCTVGDVIPKLDLIAYPIQYMSTLVQIGYEPLPPKLAKSIFGRTQLQLPGFYTYMKYVANTDGFFGMYRGLKFNIMYNIIYRFTTINVSHYSKEHHFPSLKSEEAKYKDTNQLAKSILCDSITRITALTVAYPFHLMMVRSMAQFIGRETHYDTLYSAIIDIYETGGLVGFYAGFAPFVIGECALVCLESTLMYALKDKLEQMGFEKVNQSFLQSTVNIIAKAIVYPFKLVSTVMACNGKGCRSLAASVYTAPEYKDWIECWQTLWSRNEIKRGSSIWWRYQPLTSTLMFPMQPIVRIPNHSKR